MDVFDTAEDGVMLHNRPDPRDQVAHELALWDGISQDDIPTLDLGKLREYEIAADKVLDLLAHALAQPEDSWQLRARLGLHPWAGRW